jgi:hypothetical protein
MSVQDSPGDGLDDQWPELGQDDQIHRLGGQCVPNGEVEGRRIRVRSRREVKRLDTSCARTTECAGSAVVADDNGNSRGHPTACAGIEHTLEDGSFMRGEDAEGHRLFGALLTPW